MATKDDTTNSRPASNQPEPHGSAQTPPGSSNSDGNPPPPARSAWEQAIEVERAQLLQARSVIACLYEVLLHAEGDEAVTYAEAASVAGQLIESSVERLDLVRLRPLIEALKTRHEPETPDDDRFGKYMVRDEPVAYRC